MEYFPTAFQSHFPTNEQEVRQSDNYGPTIKLI